MDEVWRSIYEPVIKGFGFSPKRVDVHDDGTLLKQQIIRYLNESDLIIADLTNERPNCYLEVGYVMGLNRYAQLILCCREDHNPDSPNYVKGGKRVHFDLQGYGIIWWNSAELEEFKKQLEEKIKRRITPPEPSPKYETQPATSKESVEAWIEQARKEAFASWKNKS